VSGSGGASDEGGGGEEEDSIPCIYFFVVNNREKKIPDLCDNGSLLALGMQLCSASSFMVALFVESTHTQKKRTGFSTTTTLHQKEVQNGAAANASETSSSPLPSGERNIVYYDGDDGIRTSVAIWSLYTG